MSPFASAQTARHLRGRPRPGLALAWRLGLLMGFGALVLYASTCARGIEWQDSAVHQYRIITGRVESPVGLALSHPLHYFAGRFMLALPFGSPLYKLNLLSGICGALGVGALAAAVMRLTRSPVAALFAGAALAISHSYWQMSALTETYTLAGALLVIEWLLLMRYLRTGNALDLALLFLINGLHVADHLLGLLTFPTYGLLVLFHLYQRRVSLRALPLLAAAWIVGVMPYALLVGAHLLRSGDLLETLRSALFGGGVLTAGYADQVLNASLSFGQLKLAILTFGYCFPSAVGLIALVGLLRRARGRRRILRRVLLAQTLIIFVFVARYSISDLYTFFVPVCALTALWFGIGLSWVWHRWPAGGHRWLVLLLVINALLPLVVYLVFPGMARNRGWLRDRLRDVPYRDEYRAFFQPWRFSDHSADSFASAVLNQVGERGWVLADSTTAFPVALKVLTGPTPESVHVYWGDYALMPVGGARVSPENILERATQPPPVVVIPGPEVPGILPTELAIVPAGEFHTLGWAGP